MPFIRSLIQKWENRKAVDDQEARNLPPYAIEAIQKVWTCNEISKDFSQQFIGEIASQMMREAAQILPSSNPFLINRIRLAASVHRLAQYLVLVLEPEPAPDITGFRDGEVTGELNARLEKLSRIKNYLRIWKENETCAISNADDLRNLIVARYKVSWAMSEFYHSLNLVLEGDHDDGTDWYRPFIHSMCASQEHQFRLDLKMTSVLDKDTERANLIAAEHSLFFNLVRHGIDHPYEAWRAVVDHIEYESDKLATFNLYVAEYPV